MAGGYDDRIIALHIEGIGSDTGEVDGLLFCYGAVSDAPTSGSGSTYEWRDALIGPPNNKSTEVDPFNAEVSLSAMTFQIRNSDENATLLLHTQTTPVTTLSTALADTTGTSVTIGSTSLAGTAIYIDGETILLGTHSGGGTYTSCTRDFWGSTADTHSAGRYVFTHPSFWRFRIVTVYEYRVQSATFVTRWRGYVAEAPSTNENGTAITVRARELLGMWMDGATVNREPVDLNNGGIAIQGGSSNFPRPDQRTISGSIDFNPNEVGQGFYRAPARSGILKIDQTEARFVALQLKDSLGLVFKEASNDELWLNYAQAELIWGGEYLEAGPVEDPIWELLWVTRAETQDDGFWGAYYVSATHDLASHEEYHPLAVPLCIMSSTNGTTTDAASYNIFKGQWALDMTRYLDLSQWIAAMDEYPDRQLDQLVLGWDGEPVVVWDVASRLMRTFGFFPAPSQTGQLGVAALQLLDVLKWDEAYANQIDGIPELLQWSNSQHDVADKVSGVVGEQPWGEGKPITANLSLTESRAAELGEKREVSYDLSFFSAARYKEIASSVLGNFAALRALYTPTLRLRVNDPQDTGVTLEIGEWVTLADVPVLDAWLVDSTGTRISSISAANRRRFAGLVTGLGWNIPNGTYDVTMLCMSFGVDGLVRYRAPSAVVDSVDNVNFKIYVSGTSLFSSDNPDNEAFEVGDDIDISNRDGSLWASTSTKAITAIGTDGTGDYLQFADWWGADPTAGLVVRCTPASGFSNTAPFSGGSGEDRLYAYMADTNEQIDGGDPDVWGF